MKILSIFLTVFLIVPIVFFLLHILILYRTLKEFGYSVKFITEVAMPNIILIVIYLGAFSLSIFFNIKKRHLVNSIVCGTMVILYFVITRFFKLP